MFMTFSTNAAEWLLRLCPDGRIEFNHKAHPSWKEEDFAREFIRIMEEAYEVTFRRKERPYPSFEEVVTDK